MGLAVPASAGDGTHRPHADSAHGRDGLVAVPLEVVNATEVEIVCTAALAHWHSAVIGRAAPGGALAATLAHDPATGALHLADGAGPGMPIEALWCSAAGRSWETRGRVALRFAAGPAPEAIALRCADAGARLSCRAAEGGRAAHATRPAASGASP